MLPENRSFLIRGDDDREYGPVGLDELREWVRENRAGLGTTVRLDEPDTPWQPWQHYPELVALLAEARFASPVPGQPGLVIAPLGRRMLACVLDLIMCYILIFPILYVLTLTCASDWYVQFTVALFQGQSPLPQPPLRYELAANLIAYLALASYMAGFHAAHGQTPAKALLRLRVVDQSGQKPGLAKAFLRGLVLVVSIFYLLGFPLTYAFFNPQRRTFHDFMAGTYVVEA